MGNNRFAAGDRAPSFRCPSTNNADFHFDTAAGRYLVLCFFGSAGVERNARVIRYVTGELRKYFDDERVSFFGVSVDPADKREGRVKQLIPGIRYFWDLEGRVSRLYGALVEDTDAPKGTVAYRSFTLVLDPNQRVIANLPLSDIERHNRQLRKLLAGLPELDAYAEVPMNAPVLVVPRVFEPEFCRQLIEIYHTKGGTESGAMTEKNGYTVGRFDHSFKRRMDCVVDDEAVRQAMRTRLNRRLLPEIYRAFQYRVTRIERYLVACYDAKDGGFFRAHRDNTTRGTAHRRFACSINLNAGEYEGGDLRFPEFGSRSYRAPTGGAVVFSCSLLHEATPVTRGVRYATLPFLFDDQAERVRQENARYLSGEVIDRRPAAAPDGAAEAG